MKNRTFIYSIPWNLAIITLGCIMVGIAIKAIVLPHGMITGGFSGFGLLLYYCTGQLTPGLWYLILNVPVFIIGWKWISKRFLFYSLFGTAVLTAAIDLISFEIMFHDPILAVLSGGVLVGAGAGLIFHSLGSTGGNDIISILLNQKYNIRIGTYTFVFNFVLFLFSFGSLKMELIIYSMAMSFISSQVIDSFLSMFNQRKMVLVISKNSEAIAKEIMTKLNKGATFLHGRGAYSGRDKDIILSVVSNYQLKRLEEVVFNLDQEAFLITENTFNVLGRGFSKRKVY